MEPLVFPGHKFSGKILVKIYLTIPRQFDRLYLGDLMSLLHSPADAWRAMGTIGVYIDESGTHEGAPYCLVAGQIGPASDWLQFTDDWNGVLCRPEYGGVVYHAGDVWKRRGVFKDWRVQKRIGLTVGLAKVIHRWKHRIRGFAYAVDTFDFARIVRPTLPEVVADPYFFCLGTAITQCLSIGEKQFPGSTQVFFADQHKEYQWRGREIYQILRSTLGAKGQLLDEELNYRSKERVPPLQAADFFAHHCFLDLSKGFDNHVEVASALGVVNAIIQESCAEKPVLLESEGMADMIKMIEGS